MDLGTGAFTAILYSKLLTRPSTRLSWHFPLHSTQPLSTLFHRPLQLFPGAISAITPSKQPVVHHPVHVSLNLEVVLPSATGIRS